MRSNYKPLGNYIHEVNVRNKSSQVTNLLGVSIQKILIPSIANTVGTDMSTYRLVKKNQFAYGPVTSRNGDKISIALNSTEDAIVSQSYKTFEIKDCNELLPEYLMMWFRRPEFDRYARFMSHGSTRETFGWNEMCETELPIPSIEKQREIVKEYNVIKDRIELNNKMITKLEETAQAIYKQWFVDFDFPDENGKPYKSSGGEMAWCEELEKEMPRGWNFSAIDTEFDVSIGRTPPRNETKWFSKDITNDVKWISIKDIVNCNSYIFSTNECLTKEAIVKFRIPIIPENTTILTFKMTVGKLAITTEEMISNEAIAHFNKKDTSKLSSEYIYCQLSAFNFNKLGTTSSIVTSINSTMIKNLTIIIPTAAMIEKFNYYVNPIFNLKKIYIKEIESLYCIRDLLLSGLATNL